MTDETWPTVEDVRKALVAHQNAPERARFSRRDRGEMRAALLAGTERLRGVLKQMIDEADRQDSAQHTEFNQDLIDKARAISRKDTP